MRRERFSSQGRNYYRYDILGVRKYWYSQVMYSRRGPVVRHTLYGECGFRATKTA